MEKSKVYFTKVLEPSSLIKLYKEIGAFLPGNVAVKLHSGEKGNQNYLKPEFVKEIIEYVNGTVVECNTAYEGARNTTDKHLELMKEHKWSDYFNVDILDSEGEEILENPNGEIIKKNYIGTHMKNYDSMLVLSHFKGHPMGGFGGALKNISIGLASSNGKRYIHCNGKENASYEDMFTADHDSFIKAMADAAKTITELYKDKIVFINSVVNLSVDCDCCSVASDPCMKDIGILASLDPLALDQACIDFIYNSKDPGRDTLVERIESRNGLLILESAEKQKIGTREYELINID
ncbi:MAG: DUF362 domain-containing protein [Candidatus Coprovivens sp.]